MYKTTLDKSPIAVIIISLDGDVKYWSPSAEKFFGWTSEDAMGNKVHDLIIPPRFREHHIASVQRYEKTGKRVLLGTSVRLPALFKNGSEKMIDLFIEDSSFEDVRQISAYAKDATQQMQLEHRAETNERVAFETLYNTLRQSELIVFAKDIEGRYTFVNDKARSSEVLFNHSGEILGKTDFDLFPKEYAAKIRDKDIYVLSKHNPPVTTAEDTIKTAKRTYTFYTTRSRTVSSSGTVTGVFSFSVDITEYKEALLEKSRLETQEILLREKIAIANSKQKSEFLANMSHEIRTPLNAITSLATLLLDTQLNDEQKDCILGLKSASDNLIAIINDILDISRIEAGKVQLEITDVDLVQLVQNIGRIFLISADTKGIRFSQSVDIPDSKRYIKCDDGRLKQILNNLLGNAVKFTEPGGTVELHVKFDDDHITFKVKDDGIGIDKDKAHLLFKPFSQAEQSITRKYGGSGLGLSISKNLVELLGGKIGFTSEKGHGSEFYFYIPFVKGKRVSADVPVPRRPSSESDGTKTIMVVDDNVMNLKVAVKFMEKLGYDTVSCNDGIEAYETYKNKPEAICLILMDCWMPKQSGYDTARLIRQLPEPYNHVPIIAMTANALQGEREHCLEAGMDDYITKPINRDILNNRVTYWLNKE